MEPSVAPSRELEDILVRLTRADDAAAVLDEPNAPRALPGTLFGSETLPPELRAAALYRHLRDIRATCAGPRIRLGRMASLDALVAETANVLATQSAAASDRRTAISMPIALLKCRYDINRQALIQSIRVPRTDAALTPDALLATFTGLFDLLVGYWMQHLPPPERFWGELHALFLLSGQIGPDSEIPNAPSAVLLREIRSAYLKPLLLGTLNPARFTVGELRQLIAFVSEHVPRAKLGATHGLFSVDLEGNRPPIYKVRDRTREHSVALCTKGLVAMLDHPEARLTARLKQDLRRYWSSEQVRSEYHQPTDDNVELVFGLEAAHQLVTGCVDDDDFLGQLGAGQRVIARAPIELHSATCTNRSPSGAQLLLPGSPESRAGELVALLQSGEPQCRLGIVRWTQLTPKLDVVTGAQWLPEGSHPCGTAVMIGKSASTPYFRSFLLPAVHGGWDVLAPSGILKLGDHLHVISHAGEMDLWITALADMTFHVSRFHTSPR